MELTPLGIEGAWLADSPLWSDDRGFFHEWFKHEELLSKTQINFSVQQANLSKSNRGVIRGIHYSLAPEGQAKWVTCVAGSIIDVIVDLRLNSPTFQKIEYVALNENDGKSVLIGSGLGHGFISVGETNVVSYLLSSSYSPEHEFGINPMDPDLKINWHSELIVNSELIISQKDLLSSTLKDQRLKNQLPR
jgi:dTDP-4-dehydrorhamnose 3,5-epimerase